jgi:hypothetical protein
MSYELNTIDARLAELPATPVTDADLDARAALMRRRIEIDQAAKATAEANSRPQPRGSLVVNVPPGVGTSHYYSNATTRAAGSAWGRVVQSRVTEKGGVVLDLFPQEFRELLGEKKFGQLWHNHNPEAVHALGRS